MLRAMLLVLAVPVVLAACGSRGGRMYGDLEGPRQAIAGVGGRICHYVGEPVVPASLDDLARPGSRGSVLLWGRDAAPGDTVELSVRYGDDGRLGWVRAIRTPRDASRVAELEQLLTASLQEEGPPDWGVRIRIVGGGVEPLLPSVICPAERGVRHTQVLVPSPTTLERQEAWQARGREIEADVGLDAEGRVVNVRLMRSSGSRMYDQYVTDLVRSYQYEPKLHDGIGVAGVLRLRYRVARN
jgi:TonB family protein